MKTKHLDGISQRLFKYNMPGPWRPNPRPFELTPAEREVVAAFHKLYYDIWYRRSGETVSTGWLGYHAVKCPLDLWAYQEIIVETRPDLIIETGTNNGGGALFLASMCQLVGKGRVISIDIDTRGGLPAHALLDYWVSSSTERVVFERLLEQIAPGDRVMVILDSDHSAHHVLEELRLYGQLVTPGCYMIVEDSNVNGHPAEPGWGAGPFEAVAQYMTETDAFEIDRSRERFLMTLAPDGFLRRRQPGLTEAT